jgi:hypothetical protein
MAIAHDTTTNAALYQATGTQTTSHAANASARAAVVLIEQDGSTADQVSGVTYGGVSMTRLGSDTDATEAGRVYIYFLDNISGGTQNVAMTTTGTIDKYLSVSTMTVAASTKVTVAGDGYISGTGTSSNPPLTLTGLTASVPVVAYEVIHSGLQTMTTTPQTTPAWTYITGVVPDGDLGTTGYGMARIANTPSGTTLTAGWIAGTSDDYVIAGVAFFEDDDQFLDVAGIASAQALGTPVAQVGSITGIATGIASAQALGTVTATSTVSLTATGIASAQAVGTPVSALQTRLTVTGIASAGALGTPVAQIGYPQTAVASGIATAQAVGTPVGVYSNVMYPAGIASAQAFGTPLGRSTATATVTGIASAGAVPTPVLGAPIRLTAVGIDDSAIGVVGVPVMIAGPATLTVTGIPTASVVPSPILAQVEETWGFLLLI